MQNSYTDVGHPRNMHKQTSGGQTERGSTVQTQAYETTAFGNKTYN